VNITQAQVQNILRHIGTFAGGAIALAGTLAVLSSTQSVDATAALQDIIAGLSQAWDGAWRLGVILGPALMVVMARWGHKAVSPPAQIQAVDPLKPDGSVKVLVAPDAPPAAIAAAKDPKQPNVVEVPPQTPALKAASPR
jgi:hypothetical protein